VSDSGNARPARPSSLIEDSQPRKLGRRLFVSYSHCTAEVEFFVRNVESQGLSCWFAPRDLRHGAAWAGKVADAIHDACGFVLLLNADAAASEHCAREAVLAMEGGIPMWLVRLDGSPLSGSLAYCYAGLHYTSWQEFDFSDFFGEVTRRGLLPMQLLRPVAESSEVEEALEDAEAARRDGEDDLAERLFESALEFLEDGVSPAPLPVAVASAFAALQGGETLEAKAAMVGLRLASLESIASAAERAKVAARLRLIGAA